MTITIIIIVFNIFYINFIIFIIRIPKNEAGSRVHFVEDVKRFKNSAVLYVLIY